MQINTSSDRPQIKAVLGPTNTGKTHLAMERMLGHESGVIGFPLRLLARENYDRAVREKGVSAVALVTGEEKIIPSGAKYFITTVESMPTDREFDFVGIDEIQMCGDTERGHIFTQRLLHARGAKETMFLGAATIRPLIERLVPDVDFIARPRLSTLNYNGYRKLTKLKPRSCIVAFSANDVYSIAELIRRTSGGAAIVMGALSPRTRNAQVEMFQSGDVDYLVATDAVGMGLNMDVDHVALAQTRKFDGRQIRDLVPAELGQIAGRAGRHMNDGTFGTTAETTGLSPIVAEAISSHSFKPLKNIFWRNSNLDFSSLETLAQSLAQGPGNIADCLVRAREADDEMVLTHLMAESDIKEMALGIQNVRLLWDVCRIPDFRRTSADAHANLLGRIYKYILDNGRIPDDWLAERIKRVNRIDGDIDTLMARIAFVRTWTFISHQTGWLDDSIHWQEKTKSIEDSLSDALHEKLTQRFVDVRTSKLALSLQGGEPLSAAIDDGGALEVEGHVLGKLSGFRFVAEKSDSPMAARVLDHAAAKALRGRIVERIGAFANELDGAFSFDANGQIFWRDDVVAKMIKGSHMLRPDIKVLPSDMLHSEDREIIENRLKLWIRDLVRDRLGLLQAAETAPLKGVARGLVFRLSESLGAFPRFEADSEIKGLTREDRKALRKIGIKIGRHLVYIPSLLRPAQVELSVLLWAIHAGETPLPPPPAGRVSLRRESHQPEGWLRAAGFRPAGALFVRADMLERVSELAWNKIAKGPFAPNEEFLSLLGCGNDDIGGILHALGFDLDKNGKYALKSRGKSRPKNQTPNTQSKPKNKSKQIKKPSFNKKLPHKTKPVYEKKIDPDSPFAKLRDLKLDN
ncbi:MAG: helicase-related protein [Rhodospirillaceae bacterium]|nr:helicase-related protein [Rhodospirillaceae bacterium]